MDEKMIIPGPDGASDSVAEDGERPESLDWDFLLDFHAMIKELRATEGIVDVHYQLHDPVPEFTIETIEHGLGIQIPRRIKSFYRLTDGLEFTWSYEEEGTTRPGGGAYLFDFATVFDNWLEQLWQADAEHTEEQGDFLWNLRGFDDGFHPDTDQMVVLCVEEDYPTYDLFIHDLQSRTSRFLELSFREYFDSLLACRATYGWRLLLTEEADLDDARAEHFFEVVERFFPEADFEPPQP